MLPSARSTLYKWSTSPNTWRPYTFLAGNAHRQHRRIMNQDQILLTIPTTQYQIKLTNFLRHSFFTTEFRTKSAHLCLTKRDSKILNMITLLQLLLMLMQALVVWLQLWNSQRWWLNPEWLASISKTRDQEIKNADTWEERWSCQHVNIRRGCWLVASKQTWWE
jgi:hypothetical protein